MPRSAAGALRGRPDPGDPAPVDHHRGVGQQAEAVAVVGCVERVVAGDELTDAGDQGRCVMRSLPQRVDGVAQEATDVAQPVLAAATTTCAADHDMSRRPPPWRVSRLAGRDPAVRGVSVRTATKSARRPPAIRPPSSQPEARVAVAVAAAQQLVGAEPAALEAVEPLVHLQRRGPPRTGR